MLSRPQLLFSVTLGKVVKLTLPFLHLSTEDNHVESSLHGYLKGCNELHGMPLKDDLTQSVPTKYLIYYHHTLQSQTFSLYDICFFGLVEKGESHP